LATAAVRGARRGVHRLLGTGDLTAEGDIVCVIGEFAMNETAELPYALAAETPSGERD
jgi:hypothetical protein